MQNPHRSGCGLCGATNNRQTSTKKSSAGEDDASEPEDDRQVDERFVLELAGEVKVGVVSGCREQQVRDGEEGGGTDGGEGGGDDEQPAPCGEVAAVLRGGGGALGSLLRAALDPVPRELAGPALLQAGDGGVVWRHSLAIHAIA